jgi:quinol monooxygenase YgiN
MEMKLRIGNGRMQMMGAVAMLLSLLVSAGGQTTRENTATQAGASPTVSTANAASNSTNGTPQEMNKGMLVRISEIEIHADHLEEYKAILKEEAEASVRLEPGVISIFPMYQKENPTEVRILEIYASREAYEAHLKTPHFQKYKTTTLKMVKSLKLVDMDVMDAKTMTEIFKKM